MTGRLEAPNMRAMWMAAGALVGVVLFRTNSGKAWVSGAGPVKRLADGSVLVRGTYSRPADAVPGQGDLNGWTTKVITPEMVGCKVAVWTCIEAKREKGGVVSDTQMNFIAQVQQAGGIAGVANTPAIAQSIIKDWRPPRDL